MKKQVREILSKYRVNQGYTMEDAEQELLDLFNVTQRSEPLLCINCNKTEDSHSSATRLCSGRFSHFEAK